MSPDTNNASHLATRAPEPSPAFAALDRLLRDRILMLDGAMGTMIQRHTLTEGTSAASGSRTIRRISAATATCSS